MSYDCYCDYDPPAVFRKRAVKAARKPHKCCECGRAIAKGEAYTSNWGIWDGAQDTYRWCSLCAEMCEWAQISVPCFCWCYMTLHEDVRQMVGEVRRDVPGFVMEWGRRAVAIKRAGGMA